MGALRWARLHKESIWSKMKSEMKWATTPRQPQWLLRELSVPELLAIAGAPFAVYTHPKVFYPSDTVCYLMQC
jgi:hypothetical protein